MQQINLKTFIPLVLAGKLPLITVKIDGENKQFLLDNGAPTMILNSKYDDGSGTSMQAFTTSGQQQNIQSKNVTTFEWEDIRFENQFALVMDLTHFETDADTTIHGIVGASIMMNHDLLLNFPDKKVGLINLPENPPNLMEMVAPALIGNHQVVPTQMAHHFPLIALRIGGKLLNMALSMGACVNTISRIHHDHFLQQCMLTDEIPAVIRGLGTVKHVSAYSLTSAIVGAEKDVVIDNMLFAFDDLEVPGANIDGLLGYELFSMKAAIIRFNRRELLISK